MKSVKSNIYLFLAVAALIIILGDILAIFIVYILNFIFIPVNIDTKVHRP